MKHYRVYMVQTRQALICHEQTANHVAVVHHPAVTILLSMVNVLSLLRVLPPVVVVMELEVQVVAVMVVVMDVLEQMLLQMLAFA